MVEVNSLIDALIGNLPGTQAPRLETRAMRTEPRVRIWATGPRDQITEKVAEAGNPGRMDRTGPPMAMAGLFSTSNLPTIEQWYAVIFRENGFLHQGRGTTGS